MEHLILKSAKTLNMAGMDKVQKIDEKTVHNKYM